jgi:hypothetical protein
MSDFQKMAEAKKAAILSEAHKRVAEVDYEMAELERLTAKYGLTVVERAQVEIQSNGDNSELDLRAGVAIEEEAAQSVHTVLSATTDSSKARRARLAAETYLRTKNKPASLAELSEVLSRNGIRFESGASRDSLSTILGLSPNLYSISQGQGWWLKELSIPAMRNESNHSAVELRLDD